MIKLGITGGIGSGKTTACKIFESLGVPVYYADDEAKKIMDTVEVTKKIVDTFGKSILSNSNTIDRKKLGAIVFSDKQKLELLNSIIHPAVGKHYEDWTNQHSNDKYTLKEAAILFESGAYKQVGMIITVTAPLELKIKRIMNRNGFNREEALLRINNQMSDEDRMKQSHFQINNDEKSLLEPQVLNLHNLLITL